MMDNGEDSITVEIDRDLHERIQAVTDNPGELVHQATLSRIELEEAIDYTQDGGFHGPDGFAKMADDEYPTWPLGSVLGIELDSMGDGEARWTMEARPKHMNPMGTMHGGVLCDLGDAALSTAYMSTLEPDEVFTTVDLSVNFLRPVQTGQLKAIGRVIHRGQNIGMSESEISNEEGKLVAKLSGTCMTLSNR